MSDSKKPDSSTSVAHLFSLLPVGTIRHFLSSRQAGGAPEDGRDRGSPYVHQFCSLTLPLT